MNARPTPVLVVVAVLHINCGEFSRGGHWIREPTARYDCHRCGVTEGPVTGARPVAAFAEHVKRIHRERCSALAAT